MYIFLIAALIGFIPAMIAKEKGRSFCLWWIYGSVLFIVALPHSLIMKVNPDGIERQQLSQGMKKCPHCAEFIKEDTNVCSHCGLEV